jgi:hypothetical protein
MAEQVVLDVSIPISDIQQAVAEIGKMRGQVDKFKAANKVLDKTSDAYTKNALEIKKLNTEIRTNERVLTANTKAQDANEGSLDQLRAQLSQVSVQWAKLSKGERENTEEGKKLTKNKKDLTEQLKSLEKATGDTRRNVGNYSEGMKDALKSSGLFAREQQMLATAQNVVTAVMGVAKRSFNNYNDVVIESIPLTKIYTSEQLALTTAKKSVTRATKLASKALKLFKIALISTGIGAIVVAVGSLVAAFFSTQRGMDSLNKAIKPVAFAFQRLIGVFQDIATALADLDFSKAWDSLMGIGDALKEGAKDGAEFAKSQITLKQTQLALAESQGKLNRAFAEQKAIVQDVTKSDEERAKAAQEAIKSLNERTNLEANILKEQIKQAELSAAQNDTDYEAQIALADLKGQQDQLEANRIKESLEIQNQVNTLLNTAENKKVADAKKNEADKLKFSQERADEEIRIAEETAERQNAIAAAQIKRSNSIYLLGLKERLIAEEITRDEYDQRLYERELELMELQRAARVIAGQNTIEIDNKIADHKIANIKKVQGVESKSTDAVNDLKDSELDNGLKVGSELIAFTKEAAGENVGVQKVAGVAAVGVNTAQAVSKGLAEGGPILGPVFAALAIASGFVQIAKINSAPQNFAGGVIGVDGPGTGTSDGIPANISRNESVMTSAVTDAYAPQLAQMEINVGNRPNFQLGKRNFAKGIIGAGNLPAISSTRAETRAETQAVNLMNQAKIFVSVTEFQEKQTELDDARQFANIVE